MENDVHSKMPNAEYSAFVGKRLLCFDVGTKRIGFAVCDHLHILATPRGVLLRADLTLFETIEQMIVKENIGGIIVGIPDHDSDSTRNSSTSIISFVKKLMTTSALPIALQDETMSTRRAQDIIRSNGTKKKSRLDKSLYDAVASAVILQDYLQEHAND